MAEIKVPCATSLNYDESNVQGHPVWVEFKSKIRPIQYTQEIKKACFLSSTLSVLFVPVRKSARWNKLNKSKVFPHTLNLKHASARNVGGY